MSDLFFVYFCIHICIHYSLMAFMKCEGAFSNIVFQKMICHKSHIYLCNSTGHGCRWFSNIMFQKIICHKSKIYDFCVFQYYLYGCVFLEKKIKRTLFLQTLEIPKKLLQIYCYQDFCSNALTATIFKSYLSNSNFVKIFLI